MDFTQRKYDKILIWAIFLLSCMTISSLVLTNSLTSGNFHNHYDVAFDRMIYDEASRPYVYRVLTSFIVRNLTSATPELFRQGIGDMWKSRDLENTFGISEKFATEGLWAFLIMYLSLIGFAFVMRNLVGFFYECSEIIGHIISLASLASLPFLGSWFVYDFPNLFIFALCLLFMVQRNWKLYYVFFILACLSKETSVLLPFILLMNRRFFKIKGGTTLHVALQSIIWLTIFLALRFQFQDNSGSIVEFHLFDYNLKLFTQPGVFFNINLFLLLENFNIALIVFLIIFTIREWNEKPLFLRSGLLILIPLLGSSLFFGYLDETRMYMESLPILALLCSHSVMKLYKVEMKPRPDAILSKTDLIS